MFKLLRYFSLTSLLAFALVSLALGWLYRQVAVADLVTLEGEKNKALTQAFANSLWPSYADFSQASRGRSGEELRADPAVGRLRQDVVNQIQGLSVVKVKIFNLDGLTIFSTEEKQIGEEQGENPGIQSALAGQPISSLIHRDTFNAFDGELEDRDLIQSYLPVRMGSGGAVLGVFEVYSDVTPLLLRIQNTQRNVTLMVIAVLAVLYLVLFLLVRRADGIIRSQYLALEQSGAELRQARDQALQANQFKSDLIASVTHDLRTPLTVIIGYVEMLQKNMLGPVTAEQRDAIQRVIENSRHLADLINDLLYQARLDAGELKIQKSPYTLADLAEGAHSTLAVVAQAKGIDLKVEIDPALPEVMNGDLLHTRQIVNNLLGNAVKFTEQGVVTLRITRLDAQRWQIAVSDTGPGIPLEAQQRIFEPFKKAGSEDDRKYAGLGLGLHIVRRITALMDGTIEVQSEVGQGSTFRVTLPL